MQHLVPVTALFHIDKVNDDQASHIAELELTADFLGGFQVDAQDGAALVFAPALVASGVNVDGHQRFCFIDNQRAAALEGNLAGESFLKLFGDAKLIKDRLGLGIMLHLFLRLFGHLFHQRLHAIVGGLAVNQDAVDIFGEEIANCALDEIRFAIHTRRGFLVVDMLLHLGPLIHEHLEVAQKIGLPHAFAGGAKDGAHVVGDV